MVEIIIYLGNYLEKIGINLLIFVFVMIFSLFVSRVRVCVCLLWDFIYVKCVVWEGKKYWFKNMYIWYNWVIKYNIVIGDN